MCTYSGKVTAAVTVAMLFGLQATAFAADPKIGGAKSAKPQVEGIVNGQSQTITTGTDVYANETVRTGTGGVADLVFLDNTDLSVGPTSEVHLDKFVYDPTGSTGSVVIEVTQGAFRFVTGSQDKRAYQIKTPFGTLGVRGTIFELIVKPCKPGVPRDQCGQTLKLVEGAMTFTPTSGPPVNLTTPGQTVTVNGNGQVTQSTQTGTILNFATTGSTTTAALGGGGGGGAGVGPTASIPPGGGGGGGGGTTSTGTGTSLGTGLTSGGGVTGPTAVSP